MHKHACALLPLNEYYVVLSISMTSEECVRFKLPSELVRSGEDGRTPSRDKIAESKLSETKQSPIA